MDIDSIDSRFIDTDLGTEGALLGIPPGNTGMGLFAAEAPCYEDLVELIPESQWKELADAAQASKSSLAWLVVWVLNQGQEGSCVGNAFTQGLMVLLAKVFGKDFATALAAISLYKQIGRSANSGAMVSDGYEAIRDVGILPLNTPENVARFKHTMPATGFRNSYPDGWKETAAMFRVTEGHVVRSVAGIVTALLKGHPVVVGRSGHSILYLDVIFKGNEMFVIYVNSWGKWGIAHGGLESGFGLDSMRSIRASAGWAAALRVPVVPTFMLPSPQ